MMIGRIGTQNTGVNAAAINQSVSHKNKEIFGKTQQEEKIQAIISPVGKKQNMIQQLMKQKQELTERMHSLSADAAENGLDIKDQMKQYEKQMESLDEQIAQLQTQRDEEKDKEKEQTPGIYEKPKTKAEIETERFENILNLSGGIEKATTIEAVKNQIDGRTNVLKAEIKTGNGNIEAKIAEVSELETKSADLSSQIGENIHKSITQVEDIRKEDSEIDPEDIRKKNSKTEPEEEGTE